MNLKVIFFGLGSIGKRHLNNLIEYGKEHNIQLDISAYRTSSFDEITNVKTITNTNQIEDDYDVAFITNPTDKHEETLQLMKNKTRFFFVEKPVFAKSIDLTSYRLIDKQVYVAAPLRYKKVMDSIRNILKKEKIYSARIVCSSYLPDWRNSDYRKSYSSFSEKGGGVELDCIHELDYAVELFGFPAESFKYFSKKSNLEIESNDLALYLLNYEDFSLEVHLDYFGKIPQRGIELITESGKICVDLLNNEISSNVEEFNVKFEEAHNDMYLKELDYFISKVLNQKENWNKLSYANEVLKLAKE